MIVSGIILVATLIVFGIGKIPIFRVDRAGAAIIGGALIMATGVLTFNQAVQSVDFRTIILLFSMMIVTTSLKSAGFFRFIGNYLIKNLKTRKGFLFGVVITSGLLSAFFINDIVCLILTPIVIIICKKEKIPPLPYLMAVATASNIGSAGTLLGNPQNILIGSISNVSFFSYIVIAFPLAVVGLLINYLVISWFYRDLLEGDLTGGEPLRKGYHRYLLGKSLVVTLGILAGFIVSKEPAIIASLGAAYLLVTRRLKPDKIYAGIDFNLLVMFIGLFVVMGGVEQSGLMNRIMEIFSFKSFRVFSILTIALSNIFSNVPAVMLLKSFIPSDVSFWWIGLGVFSTLAGNLTVTGSVANLIVIETAKHEGIQIKFLDYFKVGFPLTLLLTLIALSYFTVIQNYL
ncbi:anion transporter [Pelotomaculum isophthalicicum JI]|uniref:Anion transporter n=2 Tax=Pelotomaculum TaxID=191373 RepID=A0A9X4H7I3_9FIRM|nr:anion transporter [Pelotomaculum isophthalicicum]MDF9409539.1 anion transporter [Pelotomaculum isophthalicicum JI]